ncbi:MAG: hypothetical protein ABI867_05855 [Kofleriaceae bacterium]
MNYLLALTVPVMMLAGCATEPDPESIDPAPVAPSAPPEQLDETPPTYRFEVEPGHSLAFYETAPGVVTIFEELDGDQARLVPRTPNIAGYFAAARPNEAMPETLRAIAQRADATQAQARPTGERGRVQVSGGQESHARLSSNADNFVNGGYCDAEWYGASYVVELGLCRINLTGGWSVVWNETRMVEGNVSAIQGNVTLRLQSGAANPINKTVSQGTTVYSIAFANQWITHRFEVLNASGDWYHAYALFRQCGGVC